MLTRTIVRADVLHTQPPATRPSVQGVGGTLAVFREPCGWREDDSVNLWENRAE